MNVNKIDELKVYIKDNKIDVVALTETWLNEDISNQEISIDDFDIIRKDRKDSNLTRGGGVMFYIKKGLKIRILTELNKFDVESLWCEILNEFNDKVVVGVVYRRPNLSNDDMTKLCEVIETSCRERVLLLGDFNLPTIDWTHLGGVTRHDDMFLEIVKDNFLTQHIMSPTRGTNILDLVITSDSNMIENLTLCEPLVNSDHVVLMFDFIFRNTITEIIERLTIEKLMLQSNV